MYYISVGSVLGSGKWWALEELFFDTLTDIYIFRSGG